MVSSDLLSLKNFKLIYTPTAGEEQGRFLIASAVTLSSRASSGSLFHKLSFTVLSTVRKEPIILYLGKGTMIHII